MQQKIFLFLIGIFFLSFTQNDWTVFSSTEGNFKVQVPGEMVEKIKTIETDIGSMAYHTFIFQEESDSADNVLYIVSYVDYPEGTMHSDSTEIITEFFETTITSATESIDGSLAYSTDESLFDYPGKLWRINYNGGAATIKTKAFLVRERYYSIQTVTQREKSLNKSIERFLDSFRLLSK